MSQETTRRPIVNAACAIAYAWSLAACSFVIDDGDLTGGSHTVAECAATEEGGASTASVARSEGTIRGGGAAAELGHR